VLQDSQHFIEIVAILRARGKQIGNPILLAYELTKRCRPEKQDILLSKVGTVGRVTVIEIENKFSLFVNTALIPFLSLSEN
jgi:hypothetical protein